uniref:KIB1-4 beta-propeller domain-containing protein n=1 Tax=Leersia perrieri TaxID=77586 RepID=A0A0D9VJU2_9ORYZ
MDPSPEFRDWANLPELPLSEVLRGLLPCLRSVHAFAAACRPWRRLLRDSTAELVRPRVPPLLLRCPAYHVVPFSPLVAAAPPFSRSYRLPPSDCVLLSASRGYLVLLRRSPFHSLHLVDALTGGMRHALPLPSPHLAYHYAALAPHSRLLLFHSKHAFFSLPVGDDRRRDWIKHSLPRAASFVRSIIEFRGRVLGLTDRAQLLEFHLDANPPNKSAQMLPAAGLPDATTFDRWHFGPHLVAAGDRLLLVLFVLSPKLGVGVFQARLGVKKVGVYALDMAKMRWEEVENIGAYSLFVDCAGRSTAACVDAGNCGVEENRIYIAAPGFHGWYACPPGLEVPLGGQGHGPLSIQATKRPPWPSQIWIYPRLFF